MGNTPFEQLYAEFCAAANIVHAPPLPVADPQGFEARLHETPVTVVATDHEGVAGIHVLTEFGLPPQPEVASVWQSLMDANFAMLSRHALCFSRNPRTGHVMLQFHTPIAGMTGETLFEHCNQFAQRARAWRQGAATIDASALLQTDDSQSPFAQDTQP